MTVCSERSTVGTGLRCQATLLFVVSVFFLSSDNTLKLFSVQASSLVAIGMLYIFVIEGLVTGRFRLKSHPLQGPLFLLLIWALLSLVLSWMDPSKIVPETVYGYAWTKGANSPAVRGVSFLIRLFLSVFAIEFIISSVDTKAKFFKVLNTFIIFYAAACAYGVVQVLLYSVFNYKFGNIVFIPHFRIGGYVGEPQTYGILLISGFFPVIAAINSESDGIWFSRRALKGILVMAMTSLLFSFSVSMLLSVVVTLLMFSAKIRKRTLLFFLLGAGTVIFLFYDFIKAAIFLKLLGEISTINIRTLTWILGYNMFAANPLSGVGIGNSPLLAESVAATLNYRFAVLDFSALRVTTLNTYLEWGAETGAVGLVILGYIAVKSWRMGRVRGGGEEFRLVKFAFGGTLVALCVSANSYGGALYLGCVALALAMFVSGVMLFNRS
ncbi:MAG: hypothetical protein Q7T18_07555 [Sedimentisphaerales bacterium]|nr:hypothetical protein [Sedimentisphaerales bacterium]